MNWLLQLDYKILELINQAGATPLLDSFMPWVTDLHKQDWFKFSVFPLLILFFIFKFKKTFGVFFIGLLVTLAISDFVGGQIVKKTFNRERPFNNPEISVIKRSHAGAKSFYSNHSSNMFAFAMYLSLFIPPARWIIFPIAALIGYSRVYNGVHYPSDVVAGALMGSLIAFGVVQALRRFSQRKENKATTGDINK